MLEVDILRSVAHVPSSGVLLSVVLRAVEVGMFQLVISLIEWPKLCPFWNHRIRRSMTGGSLRPLPVFVRFILHYLNSRFAERCLTLCSRGRASPGSAVEVAKAVGG